MFSTKSFKVAQCHYYVKTGIDIEKLESEGGIIGKKVGRRGRKGVFRHVSIPESPDYLEFRFRSYWGDMIVTRKIGVEKLYVFLLNWFELFLMLYFQPKTEETRILRFD